MLYRKSKRTFSFQKLFPENRAVCDVMSKNMVQTDRQATDDSIIRRRKDAICIPDN
jgi:hypothetical protein